MLWKRYAENVHQQLIQDPFILVNNQKKSFHTRDFFFKIRYLEEGLSKIL